MALFQIATFSALANVLVAARKLATDPDPLNRINALADLAKDGKTLAAALRGAGLDRLSAEMATRAAALDRHLTYEGWAKSDAKAIFWQVAPAALADPARLAAAALDPETATDSMVATIRASDHARDFRQTAYAETYFRKVMSGTLAVMLAERTYVDSITPALWRQVLAGQGIILETTTRIDATTQRTEAKVDAQSDALTRIETLLVDRIRPEAQGVPEATILALVHRLTPGVTGIDDALAQLRRAVEIAADTLARGEAGSNLDSFVDQVLRQVGALTREGRLDDAANLALAKLSEARAGAAQLRSTAIDALLLKGDAAAAANLIAERIVEDAPDPAVRFDALRAEFVLWYARGRDRGLQLDLEVAIALARIAHSHAADADKRGISLHNLGSALQILGSREAGTVRLEEAVGAYRAALAERTRDRVPLDWAMTQNNLANALARLGERETGTASLLEAVAAYRSALEERTRKRVPHGWAMTQMNLGNALQTLGEREVGTTRLDEAVDVLRAALEEWTRDQEPTYWATTQHNLGNALWALGVRRASTEQLAEAVTAYRAVLEEWTRDLVPLDWAMGQNNLGNALRALGQLEIGIARLEEAAAAYRAALEERTRDRVPLDWASTRFNICFLHLALFDKTADPTELDRAQAALDDARQVFAEAEASRYLAQAACQQAEIDARRR